MKKINVKTTLLEAVRDSITDASRYNPSEIAPPVAILWADADMQWSPIVPNLKDMIQGLFILGQYNLKEKIGPAIWLRCVIERALPEVEWPEDQIPVLYLPGVSRQTLRTVEECPAHLQPLVELQYRGTLWTQKNGKDWTVEAFLVSEDGGLGLDVARDSRTRQSMLGSLTQLSITAISRLAGKRLETEDFDKLMIEDTTRDLLRWLNDPEGIRAEWDEKKWSAFRSRCQQEYDFDPESEGELAGGEKMGLKEGPWSNVWERFKESPALYTRIPDLLRRAKPSRLLFDKEPWPDENEKAEGELRKELRKLADLNPSEAKERIAVLEKEHAMRRAWVWADIGWSTLALALEDLSVLADITGKNIGGSTPDEMAKEYIKWGYKVDDATIRAMGICKSSDDMEAVASAVRALSKRWLEASAGHLQKLISKSPLPCLDDESSKEISAVPGQCLLFVDGLRYDLGMRLATLAEKNGLKVTRNWRWAAFPTVTATAKPAASPASKNLKGNDAAPDFIPQLCDDGISLNSDRFRKLLNKEEYQVLGDTDSGDPIHGSRRAWSEYGEFDKLGHSFQSKMSSQVEEQLNLIMNRISQLLSAGWKSVRVVTDHGWLLMPGGLDVEKLPHYLAKTRWSRCAVVKEEAHPYGQTSPWYWNKEKLVAFCRDSHSYYAGNEYAHGGISLQECVVPDILIRCDEHEPTGDVSIKDVQWLGLRCRIYVEPATSRVFVDIRTKANDAKSSITEAKSVDSEGKVGLLVIDEDLEGTSASIVLLDAQGRLLIKKPTIVGEGGED